MKRFFLLVLACVVALVGVMAVRAAQLPSPPPPAPAGATIAIDEKVATDRLAGAVRFKTVSYVSGGLIDTAAFLGFHDYLKTAFPLVHSTLKLEKINGLSLLYTWTGIDSSAPPLVLMGHMDVVPVPEPNLPEWKHGPFSGDVAEGYVWGRGTLDDKTTVLAVLEGVEGLLKAGVRPSRTVLLTFGHDEEVGGRFGARAIVDTLVARGVKPALVIDEGGFMATGALPGIKGQAAIVGIAEKGYISLRIKATAKGGHSSMPTQRTAVGALSRAIAALEANPFPSELSGPTRGMLQTMAEYSPFSTKMVLGNLWLTSPLVKGMLSKTPLGAAMLHTTTSPTMLNAGVKDNVLPPEATAVVNFRIAPGETQETVMARVRQVINDSLVTVEPTDSARVNPSPVSDVNSAGYKLVANTIRSMAPGKVIPVIPYLVMGGTDAKYWGDHSSSVFRFLAIPLGEGDESRVHGVNERVRASDYATSVGFFSNLIKGLDQLK